MKTRCACLALCLCVLPVLTVSAKAAPAQSDSLPAATVVAPVAAPSAAAPAQQAEAAEAAPAPAGSAPPPTVAAPAAPAKAAAADTPPGPIAVGPFTLNPKKFGQKADTVTVGGEVTGGKPCKQLTLDFSLRNPVQPQDLILRETIEDYDPQKSRPFERNAAAINDVKAWKSWEMAYISLQCINNEGHMSRYTAQPKK